MKKDVDVVVVGAGPAGSTAARVAAESGARAAVDSGADIRVGTLVDGLLLDGKRVTGVSANGPRGRLRVRARVTVAADGVMSRLAHLNDFIRSRPELRDGKIVQMHAGAVPVGGPARRSVADGLLVVGDAARHVHALDGGGIDYALQGGAMPGRVAAGAAAEDDGSKRRLSEYERMWKDKYGRTLAQYSKARKVIVDIDDVQRSELMECLQGVNIETVSAREFIKVLIKKHPRLLWKLRRVF
jgi:flavin-dependent dehydrogenase